MASKKVPTIRKPKHAPTKQFCTIQNLNMFCIPAPTVLDTNKADIQVHYSDFNANKLKKICEFDFRRVTVMNLLNSLLLKAWLPMPLTR